MQQYKINAIQIKNDKIDYSKFAIDKIGGYPTHLPPNDVESYGYFLMQIYNSEIYNGRQDILCWQLYQLTEFGGATEIVEVPVGAKLNTEKNA